MKKIILAIIALLIGSNFMHAQFKLTNSGFVSTSDETKDYCVIDIPDSPQTKLFQKTKIYLNSLYNNPKYVTNEVENSQIVIDAIDSDEFMVIFILNGPNMWLFSYKYIISFKDNKIKFNPIFKKLINSKTGDEIELIGVSALGSATGIFNSKGKCIREKAKDEVEKRVNEFVSNYTKNLLNTNSNDNW